jgi:parallel beta-helix repeat protein
MRFDSLTTLLAVRPKKSTVRRGPKRTLRSTFDLLEDRRMLSATLWVDNNPADLIAHPGDFSTIGAAVAAASAGDTIKVSPGTGPYNESVLVNKTLSIIGGLPRLPGEHGATVVAVPVDSAGFDLQANNISIKSFTIRPQAAATTDVTGISTHFAFSGEQIIDNILAGDTIGLYLNSNGARETNVQGNTFASNNLPGSASGNGIYSDQGLKKAEISDNFFNGDANASIILVGGDGSTASASTHSKIHIEDNTINRDSPIIAVNMVNSEISGNTITNPLQGSGIFFGGAVTRTEVEHNTLDGNATSFTGINLRTDDVNYNVAHDASGAAIPNSDDEIEKNTVSGWGDSGIRLRDGTHDVSVTRNTVTGNGTGDFPTTGDGISIEDSSDNTVSRNAANTNRRNGIFLSNATDNTVSDNTANNNGEDGILVSAGSTNNEISKNTANHNGNFVTGAGDGIHLVDSNDNQVTKNTANSNANDGIHVAGTSSGNTIKKNTAKKNGNWDLQDETVGAGTAGTANTWTQNTATSRSPAGLG